MNILERVLPFIAAAVLAGCAVPPAAKAPLISRDIIYGNPALEAAALSPDGKHVAFLAPHRGVLNVWVAPVKDVGDARPVSEVADRDLEAFEWAMDSTHILFLQDRGGDEDWRLYSSNIHSGETRRLTPDGGVKAQMEPLRRRFPGKVLVGLNDRDPSFHDMYLVDIASGERELVEKNTEGFIGYVFDHAYEARLAAKLTPSGVLEYYRREGGEWRVWLKIPFGDLETTEIIGFDSKGTTLYALDSRGGNTSALRSYDVARGAWSDLFSDPRADVSDTLLDPASGRVQAVAATYTRKQWTALDPEVEADIAFLENPEAGDLDIVSRSDDDRHWLVGYENPAEPYTWFLYERPERKLTRLFSERPELEDAPLNPMHSVTVKSRDGLDLVSYLTLPKHSDPDGDGRPDAPLPMVLWVHGGPWERDEWQYHSYHQWLSNRGYAVLGVNYRGSTGFGKAFVNAADREWGRKMHDDLIDAVNWAKENGIAIPDRIAILGGSYGGYATLVGLAMTPDVFACGVDIVGPSNLNTMWGSIPAYWEPLQALIARRVGDPRTGEGRAFLLERSPLTYADNITKPLLIGQGANDPRVKQSESDQIVAAMKESGIPVTYVLYPDEGHGFENARNRKSFNAVAEAFLTECLGGRFEAFGDDFEGSSIQVPYGAAFIPGLPEALAR